MLTHRRWTTSCAKHSSSLCRVSRMKAPSERPAAGAAEGEEERGEGGRHWPVRAAVCALGAALGGAVTSAATLPACPGTRSSQRLPSVAFPSQMSELVCIRCLLPASGVHLSVPPPVCSFSAGPTAAAAATGTEGSSKADTGADATASTAAAGEAGSATTSAAAGSGAPAASGGGPEAGGMMPENLFFQQLLETIPPSAPQAADPSATSNPGQPEGDGAAKEKGADKDGKTDK
eukprot:GHVU01074458.1.p1 GENE.GHVU01074458.1~~GHVU01074458.1.p1  ORF type:complete len:233 (-),score=34.02 GHVU01074458.1:434-1132(-)